MLTSTATAADSDWKLVFQDDFERAQLGTDWTDSKKLSIVNGRMHMIDMVNAAINRSFKPDVRLEFDAWALDDTPPCDMSATLGSGPGLNWGYLLGFGARSNHANHLKGPGVEWADLKPPFPIEHGKKYHCVAQKEGKHISYTVNGTVLFDVKVDDPIGGPGFDRAGVLTWTGMDVDNVKVYERITPHPDTPRLLEKMPEGPLYRDGRTLKIRTGAETPALQAAVDSFNSGNLDESLKQFRAMGGTLTGLLGQAYVLGDLMYVEPFKNTEFDRLAKEFDAASKANPNDNALADYALASKWFTYLKMKRTSEASVATIRFDALGPNNNPFYHKSEFYRVRYSYWNGKEGGDTVTINRAVEKMREIKKLWPENSVVKQYAGDKVPWGNELIADTSKHPAWAAYLREAYARDIAIMEYFINERQAADGSFGGGYGDDCELMRSWMQISAISSASEGARTGIQNLAQGIWDNVLLKGYHRELADVEHSSEVSADMLPGMLFLRYGDPLWAERNMESCKTIKDYYMGTDANGYPRFKSSYYGGLIYEKTTMGGGDTGYNARTMKHMLWQAWQGNQEAKDLFVRWAEGWRVATMSQIDGKVPGVVPPTIWWPSGSIFPPVKGKPWYDEKLNYWSREDMMIDVFLAAYYFSGDRNFLKPFQFGMEMGTSGPYIKHPNFPRGSREWQLVGLQGFSGAAETEQNKNALYRWLTGDTVYDDYLLRYGDRVHRFRVNGDLNAYTKGFQTAAESIRSDMDLQTTEVLSTDRAGVLQPLTIFGAYTGAITGMRDAATPTFAVTYNTPSTDFAALVVHTSKDRMRVWLYNFEDKPMPIGLKLWRLQPGSYTLSQGVQVQGEGPDVYRYTWEADKIVKITHRADGPTVMVPPGKVWCVDLRLDQPIKVPATAPYMAIGKTDIAARLLVAKLGSIDNLPLDITFTIHNIGNAVAKPFTVALQQKIKGNWKTIAEQKVSALPAPKNFEPSTTKVMFKHMLGDYRVSIDPKDEQYELCETNNTVDVSTKGRILINKKK